MKHEMLPVFGIWLLGGSPEIAIGLQGFLSGCVCCEAQNAARFRNLAPGTQKRFVLAGLNAAPEFLDLFLARNRFLPSRGPSRTFGSFEGPVCQRRQIKKCTIRKTQQTPLCPRILCRTPIFWGCPFSVIFSSNIPWNFYVQGWKMTPQAYVFMGQIQLAENDFAIFRTHVCIHS